MDLKPQTSDIKTRIGVIDVIAQDPKKGEVVLVMTEPNEWDGSDDQLFSLQERFNAYVSFLLDGEMAEAHPELANKPTRIELRCAHIPDTRALELLGQIHDQLAFQDIRMEVVVKNLEGSHPPVIPSEVENGAAGEAATWTERQEAARTGSERIKSRRDTKE
jgi:Family of unknown function (DUF6572)